MPGLLTSGVNGTGAANLSGSVGPRSLLVVAYGQEQAVAEKPPENTLGRGLQDLHQKAYKLSLTGCHVYRMCFPVH
jgi:hypothetical protein